LLENNLKLLLEAADNAGQIALEFFKKNPKVWYKDADQGPVTEADIKINEMLIKKLQCARPEYGWLSEETEDNQERLSKDYVFIIDPIDGTRSFIDGHENYACALGISFKGQMQTAVVQMPSLNKIFWANIGQGTYENGKKVTVSSQTDITQSSLLTAKPNLDPSLWPGGVPPVKQAYRSSLAYRLCLAANGSFDAMVTLRDCWEWDIAAGDLIVREAGGKVTDRLGNDLHFNNCIPKRPGVLAGSKSIHSNLLRRL
jgi:myo-inositol-1(or 4)-monophosphatase